MVIFPALFFLLKTIFTVWCLFWFLMNFRRILSIFVKNEMEISYCFKFLIPFDKMVTLLLVNSHSHSINSTRAQNVFPLSSAFLQKFEVFILEVFSFLGYVYSQTFIQYYCECAVFIISFSVYLLVKICFVQVVSVSCCRVYHFKKFTCSFCGSLMYNMSSKNRDSVTSFSICSS